MVLIETLLELNRNFFSFWGYVIVFLAIFLESFPFLGAFVPGGIITLVLVGLLSKLGFFVLWKIVTVCIISSILIDTFSYFFGRSVNKDFFHKHARILFIKRETIRRVGCIVKGHTGKALVLGRLNPVTRSIAPFIVGNEKVEFPRFMFYNVVGAILWVFLFTFAGYIFGNSFQFVKNAEVYILWGTIIIIGGFYVYYLANLFKMFFGRSREGIPNGANCKK